MDKFYMRWRKLWESSTMRNHVSRIVGIDNVTHVVCKVDAKTVFLPCV